MTKYVAILAVDPENDEVLLLEKLKGPAHLIGKHTVPGGKIEDGEHAFTAAVRELHQESGVQAMPEEMSYLGFKGGDDWGLHIYSAITDLSKASAQPDELEKIYKYSFSGLISEIEDSFKNGTQNRYVFDMGEILLKFRNQNINNDRFSKIYKTNEKKSLRP